MPWVKLDDHFDEHPKLAAVGPLGVALWVAGLAYCNRQLTDGFVPRAVARTLLDYEFDLGGRRYTVSVTSGMVGDDVTGDLVAELLIEYGLWEPADGGYRVHDYADYQPSKAQVLAEREAAKERMARARGKTPEPPPPSPEPTENGTGTSVDVRQNVARSSSTPDPVPDPELPTEVLRETHTARAREGPRLLAPALTEDQAGALDALHEQVQRLVYAGSDAPPPGWCEDLITRGATRTDIEHAVQAAVSHRKRSREYVRVVLEGRVQEREQGRDPDARPSVGGNGTGGGGDHAGARGGPRVRGGGARDAGRRGGPGDESELPEFAREFGRAIEERRRIERPPGGAADTGPPAPVAGAQPPAGLTRGVG